ncbi:MAG: hypothetical protein J6T83_08765, partial [Paludibacteraceae bacterium]|nr:hypothetical protein [Paludibacteraceae bacterium]
SAAIEFANKNGRRKKLPVVILKDEMLNGELEPEPTIEEPIDEKELQTRKTIEAIIKKKREAAAAALAAKDSTQQNDTTSVVDESIPDSLNLDSLAEDIDVEMLKEYAALDSTLLAQQLAELEEEMRNMEELKEAEKAQKEGKSEEIVAKIKIPKCRYLNEVHYDRGKFKFIYDYDFFMYYWHQRYFYKKRFYDRVDTGRVIAKKIMDLVGNTQYRRVLLNDVVDSVMVLLPQYSAIDTLVDSVMTELNLEYLATGEIKIYYKKRRQKKIRAKYLPSAPDNKPLGHIKFYTRNRRKVIEELDAAPWDSILLAMEDTVDEDMVKMTDSLEKLRTAAEASSVVLDSLQKQAERQALIDRITGRKKKQTDGVATADSAAVISEEEQSETKGVRRFFKKKDSADPDKKSSGVDESTEPKEKKRSRRRKDEEPSIDNALTEDEIQRRKEEEERQALIDRITGRSSKAKQEEDTSAEPQTAATSEEQSDPQVEQTEQTEQVEQSEPKEKKRSRRKKEEAAPEETPAP